MGQARLRITVSSGHTGEQIDALVNALGDVLGDVLGSVGVPWRSG